ncbi:hypothetical protein JL36_13480 [Lactococcus cremoris]|nr:hypothetical protein JL36_13480 [Lactococcus cremoris]
MAWKAINKRQINCFQIPKFNQSKYGLFRVKKNQFLSLESRTSLTDIPILSQQQRGGGKERDG